MTQPVSRRQTRLAGSDDKNVEFRKRWPTHCSVPFPRSCTSPSANTVANRVGPRQMKTRPTPHEIFGMWPLRRVRNGSNRGRLASSAASLAKYMIVISRCGRDQRLRRTAPTESFFSRRSCAGSCRSAQRACRDRLAPGGVQIVAAARAGPPNRPGPSLAKHMSIARYAASRAAES